MGIVRGDKIKTIIFMPLQLVQIGSLDFEDTRPNPNSMIRIKCQSTDYTSLFQFAWRIGISRVALISMSAIRTIG